MDVISLRRLEFSKETHEIQWGLGPILTTLVEKPINMQLFVVERLEREKSTRLEQVRPGI